MNELVTTPRYNTPYGSLTQNSYSSSFHSQNNQHNLNYSFINKEFIDDNYIDAFDSSFGKRGFSHTLSASRHHMHSFRHVTSTPNRGTPASLPKSLPIDWNLFNKQYKLKQKLKRVKSKESVIENNFENLPYQIIDFISDCVESQNDLIALSQTCTFFNNMINKRLYKKILIIDDINLKFKHFDSSYTLLNIDKYPKFLASLHSNPETLVKLIKEIVIDTSSLSYSFDDYNSNIYESLYDLFLTNDNNLQVLENLDVNNLKKYGSLLKYNHDHLIRHNYNKYTYHYNQTENLNDLIKRDMLNLKNFQILNSFEHLNKLPESCEMLSLLIEHEYQINNDELKLELLPSSIKILENLTYLQLNTTVTFDTFISELNRVNGNVKLHNLKSLSLTSVHHDNVSISYDSISRFINLGNLKSFELKVNCHERVTCNFCIIKFLSDWASSEPVNLEKLSILSLPPSSQYNFEIQWDYIMTNIELSNAFLKGLKYLYINLNDFPFIPLFVKTNNVELTDFNSLKLPINGSILSLRLQMFDTITSNLGECENLQIVDWFYNWLIYLNMNLDGDDDSGLNFLNYLNNCHCQSCVKARHEFKLLNGLMCFKDFKKRFKTDLNYGSESFKDGNTLNIISENPDEYRILYNHILSSLKNRIPLNTSSAKISTSLKFDTFRNINEISTQLISREKWEVIIRLLIHSMKPHLVFILQRLRNLKRLNLGGIYLRIQRLEDEEVRIRGLYDDYDEVISLTN